MLAKKRIFICFLVFIGIVASLVIAETVLRLFRIVPMRVENESIFPGKLGDYKPSQELWSDYILPHYIKINSLGLRGKTSCERDKIKYESKIKAIVAII